MVADSSGYAKINALHQLNNYLKYSDPLRAVEVSKEVYRLGLELEDPRAISRGLSGQAIGFIYANLLDSTYQYALMGLQVALQHKDTVELNRFYQILAYYHQTNLAMDSALFYAQSTVDLGYKEFVARLNLGQIYQSIGSYAEALNNFNRALDLALEGEESTPNNQGAVFGALTGLYLQVGDIESAFEYAKRSLDLFREMDNKQGVLEAIESIVSIEGLPIEQRESYAREGLALSKEYERPDFGLKFRFALAAINFETGNILTALDTLTQLYALSQEEDETFNPRIAQLLAQIYLDRGQLDLAERYGRESFETLRSMGISKLDWGHEVLLEILGRKGDYRSYYELASEYYPLKDSIDSQERLGKMAFMQAQVEDREKQLEIDNLNSSIERTRTRRRWVSLSGILIGLIMLLIIYFRNRQVRVQRQTAEKLAQLNSELKELDEAKNTFFTNVSHELRTPLTLILGPIRQMLRMGNLTADVRKLGSLIENNASLLQRRVNEILNLTKLDSNKLAVEEESTDALALTRKAVAMFESNAGHRGINLSAEMPQSAPSAMIDREKVETILYNFLSNALKFTPKNGNVSLTLSIDHIQFHWKVIDTGRGIPKGEEEMIFERYFQSSARETAAEGGTGIGLAICRELAELMNGRVWATQNPEGGSIFHFTLPYQEASQKSRPIPIVATEQLPNDMLPVSEGHTGRLLIVEDNADLQAYLQQVLADYQVNLVENGRQALDFLEENQVDLIISDVMMPVMDGFELLKSVKENPKTESIPVIMLTARATMQDKLNALRIGVDDYMFKPFDVEELLARVGNSISRLKQRIPLDANELAEEPEINHPRQKWLEEMETIILRELTNKQFNLGSLADELNISQRQLQRRIKSYTGMSFTEYDREIRLHQSRSLLESGEFRTVSELSYAVGFETASYFSQLFTQRFGKKPVEYLY